MFILFDRLHGGAQSDMIALPASNDMTVFGGSIEPDGDDDRSNRKGNKSRGASRGASRGKSPEKKGQSASGAQSPSTTSGGGANALSSSQSPTRAITAASDTASPEHHDETTMVVSQGDFTAASGRDERDLEAMARAAQMERRNARSAAKMLAVAKQVGHDMVALMIWEPLLASFVYPCQLRCLALGFIPYPCASVSFFYLTLPASRSRPDQGPRSEGVQSRRRPQPRGHVHQAPRESRGGTREPGSCQAARSGPRGAGVGGGGGGRDRQDEGVLEHAGGPEDGHGAGV